ncbi:hypothetical protein BGX26_010471 [Mortierella sp. AD094]|nr:hypothetical protein BGX26_010471 [Mortierella sp. AD094]
MNSAHCPAPPRFRPTKHTKAEKDIHSLEECRGSVEDFSSVESLKLLGNPKPAEHRAYMRIQEAIDSIKDVAILIRYFA